LLTGGVSHIVAELKRRRVKRLGVEHAYSGGNGSDERYWTALLHQADRHGIRIYPLAESLYAKGLLYFGNLMSDCVRLGVHPRAAWEEVLRVKRSPMTEPEKKLVGAMVELFVSSRPNSTPKEWNRVRMATGVKRSYLLAAAMRKLRLRFGAAGERHGHDLEGAGMAEHLPVDLPRINYFQRRSRRLAYEEHGPFLSGFERTARNIERQAGRE
jgi:hypothetical protein